MIAGTERQHVERAGLAPGARRHVIEAVVQCLETIARHEGVRLQLPDIRFDLAGTAAGQYRRSRHHGRDRHALRFNPYLFARDFREGLTATVPHEVAHYAVAVLFGHRRTRPHGPEWRRVMTLLGAEPAVTHRQDLSGVPVRRQRRWRYRCACRDHELSTTRHNRIERGASYLCTCCRTPLLRVESLS